MQLFDALQLRVRKLLHRDLMPPRYFARRIMRKGLPTGVIGIVQSKFPYAFPLPRLPYVISVEPSGYCNLRCTMCPYTTSTDSKGFMDMGLYRKILSEAEMMGTQVIRFVGLGEPLLHPEFIEMVRLAKRHGLYTVVSTNATLLTETRSRELIGAGIDEVGFSLDSADPAEFEAIRVRAKYHDVMAKIDRFLELCKKSKKRPTTIARMVVLDRSNTEQFSKQWSKKVDSLQFNIVRQFTGTVYANDIASDKRQATPSGQIKRKVRCRLIRSYMVIRWNGEVRLCNQCNTIIGNANHQQLRHIWNSAIIKDVREKHRNYEGCAVAECRDCQIMEPMMLGETAAV